MFHYDYDWFITENRIVLDRELNTDKLGWKAGDLFRFENVDGRQQLVKIDPLEKFLHDGMIAVVNEEEDTVRFVEHKQHQQEVFQILGRK